MNSREAIDLEGYRRYDHPPLPQARRPANMNKGTDLDSFLERLRLGDKDGKEVRSHEGYITLGSDDGKDEDVRPIPPSAPKVDLKKAHGQDNYENALDIENKKARALPVDNDDEEERAKRAFRYAYYKKKALAHRQKETGLASEDGCDNTKSGPINTKDLPLAQQENTDECVDLDVEWKPYVPEKDNDEWEFEYYMSSLIPAEPWSPIDEL